MSKYILATVILAFLSLSPLSAQKKKASPLSPTSSMTAEQLFQNYCFDEAARALQRDIDAARRAGKGTERLEADLRRANLGSDMLRGVERVTFIDSIKVARVAMLDSLKLSPECGKITNTHQLSQTIQPSFTEVGQSAYVNEIGDRLFFSAADSTGNAKNIWSAWRTGKNWTQPQPLAGLQSETDDQDFPYMMPDGVTLYFSSQGEESLGGYDIFVTRYNPETKDFLKAENMGMPFNSPANDYLLAIDESSNLGWLITDRNQQADTVCVYIFIPTETREVYELSDENSQEVIRAARLSNIAQTQTDTKAASEARQRLRTITESTATGSSAQPRRRYVISDERVYSSLTEFRSATARRIAEQADKISSQIDALITRYEELQQSAATVGRTTMTTAEMRNISEQLPALREQYHTLCKNMRTAELK